MTCPACEAENVPGATACIACGEGLAGQAPTLAAGAVFAGRYEILGTVGRGGMGMVYRARDRDLREVVALKMIRPDLARQQHMERRFRSEIKLARRVRHPNVCSIYGDGEDHGLLYICMELVDGTDLRDVVRPSGVLPRAEAFDIAIQVAEGLKAIHDVGIIHRDLKTANIMRDRKGVVRLMDFGIAKKSRAEGTTGGTATGQVLGTPEYMSPEQIRGEKVDFRTDVYALGIVIHEIFTGIVPFRGETTVATIFKHLQAPPRLVTRGPGALPRSLVPLLRRALAKAPGQRFANAGEMLAALRRTRDDYRAEPDTPEDPAAAADVAGMDTGADHTADAAPTRDWSARADAALSTTMGGGEPPVWRARRRSPYVTAATVGAVLLAIGLVPMATLQRGRSSAQRDTRARPSPPHSTPVTGPPSSVAATPSTLPRTPSLPPVRAASSGVPNVAPTATPAVSQRKASARPAGNAPSVTAASAVVYDEKDVTVRPVKLTGASPEWPRGARPLDEGERVSVTFAFVVTEKGDVTDFELLDGTDTSSPMGMAVLTPVSRWKFSPGLKDGVPVRVRRKLRHTFLGGTAPPFVPPVSTSPEPGDALKGIWEERNVDVRPLKIAGVSPEFPPNAPAVPLGQAQVVTVTFVVSESGDVRDVRSSTV